MILKLSTIKAPSPDGFTAAFYHTFKELITVLHKHFQKIEKQKTLSNPFCEANISLIQKPDEDITRKENYKSVSLMNINTKILNKILRNQVQQHISKVIHRDKVVCFPGKQMWIHSQCHTLCQEKKGQNHMVISIEEEKAFDHIQHLLVIKERKPQ